MQVSKAEFIQLYKQLSIKMMAEKLGYSRTTIKNWANKFGLPNKINRENKNNKPLILIRKNRTVILETERLSEEPRKTERLISEPKRMDLK